MPDLSTMPHYVPELMVGIILIVFGWGFRSWSVTLRSGTSEIIKELKSLNREFHDYRLATEKRLVRIEVELQQILSGRLHGDD